MILGGWDEIEPQAQGFSTEIVQYIGAQLFANPNVDKHLAEVMRIVLQVKLAALAMNLTPRKPRIQNHIRGHIQGAGAPGLQPLIEQRRAAADLRGRDGDFRPHLS